MAGVHGLGMFAGWLHSLGMIMGCMHGLSMIVGWLHGLARFLGLTLGGYQVHTADGAPATRLGAHDLWVHGTGIGRYWRLGPSMIMAGVHDLSLVMAWNHGLALIMPWVHGLGVIMPWVHGLARLLVRCLSVRRRRQFLTAGFDGCPKED